MNTLNIEAFKSWSKQNAALALRVVAATAYAETMKKHVNAIKAEILKEIALYDDLDTPKSRRITDPRETWMSDDEASFLAYLKEADKRTRSAGLKPDDMPVDFCPALVAECNQSTLENEIIVSGSALMGINTGMVGGENRDKLLKLLMGAAIKASKEL